MSTNLVVDTFSNVVYVNGSTADTLGGVWAAENFGLYTDNTLLVNASGTADFGTANRGLYINATPTTSSACHSLSNFVWTAGGGNEAGVALMWNSTTHTGYLFTANERFGANSFTINRVVSGTGTSVATAAFTPPTAGSAVALQLSIDASGNLTGYYNGTSVVTYTDSSPFTTGEFGLEGINLSTHSFYGVSDAAATPVSFSGTVGSQTGTVGSAFSLNLSTYFSGTETPFTYSLTTGSLTGTGLSLNTSTGVISGTPTATASLTLAVTATDTGTNTAVTNSFSLTIGAATPIAFTGTVPAQSVIQGNSFSLDLTSYFSGSLTPFTYAVTTGTLPTGLTISSGVISGTPTVAGSVSIVVTGTDTGSHTAATNSFNISVTATTMPYYESNFALTENPLSEGGVWTDGNVNTGRTAARSDGVHAFGTMVSFDTTNYIDSCAALSNFLPDQEITGVLYNSGAISGLEAELLLCAKFTSTSITAYELDLVYSSNSAYLVRWDGPSNTFTQDSAGPYTANVSLADGAVWVSKIVDGKLTVTCNGNIVILNRDLTAAFTSYPSLLVGSPGIGFWCETGNSADPTKMGWKSITAATPASTLAKGTFTGTGDAALSANWTTVTSQGTITLNGNEARYNGTTPGTAAALYSGALVGGGSWTNDQFSEITVGSVVGSVTDEGVGPMVRASSSASTFYFAQTNAVETKLYKCVAGTFTQLGSNAAACATGDVLRLNCVGTALTVKKNGVSIITATDSAITSGSAGMWATKTGGPATIATWDAGTLATTAVSFSGTVGAQTATVGVAFSLNLSTYFTGSQTPFSYAVTTGSLSGTGLTLNSGTGVISGTPTSAASLTLIVTATDTSSSTATTNSFTLTISAGADTTPPNYTGGTISGSAITSTSYTLGWSAATDNVAVTGYKYSIDGGTTYVDAGNVLSVSITGRTPGATDSVAVKAYDAAGNLSSAVTGSVTLSNTTVTTDVMSNGSGSPLVSTLFHYSFWPTGRIGGMTGVTVYEGTVTTNTSGVATITNLLPQAGVLMMAYYATAGTSDATTDMVYYQAVTPV